MIRGQSAPYHRFAGDSIPAASVRRVRPQQDDDDPTPHTGRPAPSRALRDAASDTGTTRNSSADDEKDTRNLATFLIDLPAKEMERRLGDALSVYVDAMRYPRGTE